MNKRGVSKCDQPVSVLVIGATETFVLAGLPSDDDIRTCRVNWTKEASNHNVKNWLCSKDHFDSMETTGNKLNKLQQKAKDKAFGEKSLWTRPVQAEGGVSNPRADLKALKKVPRRWMQDQFEL